MRARVTRQVQGARVGTTHMKGRKRKQTGSLLSRVINQLGRTSARLNARGVVVKQHTTRDQPRANSPINDNYYVHRSPGGLLAGSQTTTQELFLDNHVNFHVVIPVPTTPGQSFWQTWLDLGAGPKVVQILREGYTLPVLIRPNLTMSPTVISCYGNPHRNLSLLEALHQLIDKNAIELVVNKKSLGSFNLFWCPNPTTSGDPS